MATLTDLLRSYAINDSGNHYTFKADDVVSNINQLRSTYAPTLTDDDLSAAINKVAAADKQNIADAFGSWTGNSSWSETDNVNPWDRYYYSGTPGWNAQTNYVDLAGRAIKEAMAAKGMAVPEGFDTQLKPYIDADTQRFEQIWDTRPGKDSGGFVFDNALPFFAAMTLGNLGAFGGLGGAASGGAAGATGAGESFGLTGLEAGGSLGAGATGAGATGGSMDLFGGGDWGLDWGGGGLGDLFGGGSLPDFAGDILGSGPRLPNGTPLDLALSKIPGGTSILNKVLSGNASQSDITDLLGKLGAAGLQAYGSSQQSEALNSLANRYNQYGAPSRARYEASMTPGFDPQSIPGYAGALDTASKSLLARLSAQNGNPFGNPGGLIDANKQIVSGTALPAINEYQRMNANTGFGNSMNSALNLQTGAIGADNNVLAGLAAGLGSVTAPKNNLAALLAQLQGAGGYQWNEGMGL